MRPVKDKPVRLGGGARTEPGRGVESRNSALVRRVAELERRLARANKLIEEMSSRLLDKYPEDVGPLTHWLEK